MLTVWFGGSRDSCGWHRLGGRPAYADAFDARVGLIVLKYYRATRAVELCEKTAVNDGGYRADEITVIRVVGERWENGVILFEMSDRL